MDNHQIEHGLVPGFNFIQLRLHWIPAGLPDQDTPLTLTVKLFLVGLSAPMVQVGKDITWQDSLILENEVSVLNNVLYGDLIGKPMDNNYEPAHVRIEPGQVFLLNQTWITLGYKYSQWTILMPISKVNIAIKTPLIWFTGRTDQQPVSGGNVGLLCSCSVGE